jgi:hypothetical protein
MKRILILMIILCTAAASCTTMDPSHRPANGKRAYAAKAPKNKSAWK